MRIVSLLPGNTEMVCLLGLRDALVGISHECDYPDDVASLPRVTRSRVDAGRSQGEINTQVAELSRAGHALFTVDEELMRELEPDLILTQAKCDVCAVDVDEVTALVHRLWPESPPQVLSFQPSSVWDVLADVYTVGNAAGVEARARQAVRGLSERSMQVAAQAAECPVAERPGVVFLEWMDPPMSCGSWQPEMVRLAGGRCLLSREFAKARWVTAAELTHANPEVLILGACGRSLEQNREATRDWYAQGGLAGLSAAREGRVYVVDGHHLFNRPGPRLVDSLELLGAIVRGDSLDAWERAGLACRFTF